jgi:hypothetical protein
MFPRIENRQKHQRGTGSDLAFGKDVQVEKLFTAEITAGAGDMDISVK